METTTTLNDLADAEAFADALTAETLADFYLSTPPETPFYTLVIVRADRRLNTGLRAAMAAEREALVAAQVAAAEARAAYRLSDEGLAETIAEGEGSAPGPYRQAKILLTIHPDDRAAALAAAHRFLNATADAGRPSDALRSVASDFRRVETPCPGCDWCEVHGGHVL